jgi:hypothetical protein
VLRPHPEGVLLDILVQPRASRPRVGPVHDGRLKVAVTAPPVEGAANRAVVDLLADLFDCPRGQIEVMSGASGRRKTVLVRGQTVESAARLLAAAG